MEERKIITIDLFEIAVSLIMIWGLTKLIIPIKIALSIFFIIDSFFVFPMFFIEAPFFGNEDNNGGKYDGKDN